MNIVIYIFDLDIVRDWNILRNRTVQITRHETRIKEIKNRCTRFLFYPVRSTRFLGTDGQVVLTCDSLTFRRQNVCRSVFRDSNSCLERVSFGFHATENFLVDNFPARYRILRRTFSRPSLLRTVTENLSKRQKSPNVYFTVFTVRADFVDDKTIELLACCRCSRPAQLAFDNCYRIQR